MWNVHRYENLAAFGKKVLKPAGSLLAMAGVFENKLNTLMPYLVKTARGDEDFIQEGAIEIWESMKKVPYADNKCHATKATWSIISVSRPSSEFSSWLA